VKFLPILFALAACGASMPETACVEHATTLEQAHACRAAVRAAQAEAGVRFDAKAVQ
jgi:hypothetical protein